MTARTNGPHHGPTTLHFTVRGRTAEDMYQVAWASATAAFENPPRHMQFGMASECDTISDGDGRRVVSTWECTVTAYSQ